MSLLNIKPKSVFLCFWIKATIQNIKNKKCLSHPSFFVLIILLLFYSSVLMCFCGCVCFVFLVFFFSITKSLNIISLTLYHLFIWIIFTYLLSISLLLFSLVHGTDWLSTFCVPIETCLASLSYWNCPFSVCCSMTHTECLKICV